MTTISKLSSSPRSLLKAILLPSGDHAGQKSAAGSVVNRVSPLPSAFITKTSSLDGFPRMLSNAIRVLSGDQSGRVS
jgi:hypothetical protein